MNKIWFLQIDVQRVPSHTHLSMPHSVLRVVTCQCPMVYQNSHLSTSRDVPRVVTCQLMTKSSHQSMTQDVQRVVTCQ